MTQHNQFLQTKLDKSMSTEQFNEVIAAISEGKYSWACVLILRIAGYNPLHYIPYRTYNRLMKENAGSGRCCSQPQAAARSLEPVRSNRLASLEDLDHLETMPRATGIRGGSFRRIVSTLRHIGF